MSAKSALQILSINYECNFPFSKFLIIGLCNSSANSLFWMISFLLHHLQSFSHKTYKPLKLDPFDEDHALDC